MSVDFDDEYDKPMSEEDKGVKGLQQDINKFHTDRHRATTLEKIANNNKLREEYLAQKKEDERVQIKLAEWKKTLNSEKTHSESNSTTKEPVEITTSG